MTQATPYLKKPHRRPSKGRLIFVIKTALCVLITYSFVGLSDFYAEYPKIREIAYGINTFLTASVLISIGQLLLVSWYMRRIRRNDRVRGSFVLGVNQIAAICNVIFIILGIMLALGIDPKEFLTSITIVAMAIALLFRDYITNMISGLLIMFSDQFTIGDYIKIDQHQGKITDITLVNIVVKNDDDDVVLIPNNTAFTANIINQSLQNSRKLTVDFQLPLAHSYNQEALEQRMRTLLQQYQQDVVKDSYQLKVVGVDKESVRYKVQLLTASGSAIKKRTLRDSLMKEVLAYEADESSKLKFS